MTAEGAARPALTADAVAAYLKAHEGRSQPRRDVFGSLVVSYLKSPEYARLAPSTRRQWRIWVDRAREEFGPAKLRLFSDPRMRGRIIEWRDKWAHAPRQADYALQVLSRVLSWGVQRGWILHNPAAGAPSLYRVDRSDVVWTDDEIEAVAREMHDHVARAFRLAALTGLPRGDLVTLSWDDVHEDHIGGRRGKTGVERCIPIFDETRAILAACPRTPAGTVITNARGATFTPRGFSLAVESARKAASVAKGKTLHDLRGTFATRLMRLDFSDGEIDLILGWETGKSARIRRKYISRRAVLRNAIERMRVNGTVNGSVEKSLTH